MLVILFPYHWKGSEVNHLHELPELPELLELPELPGILPLLLTRNKIINGDSFRLKWEMGGGLKSISDNIIKNTREKSLNFLPFQIKVKKIISFKGTLSVFQVTLHAKFAMPHSATVPLKPLSDQFSGRYP